MSPPAALVFDLDGTLIDSRRDLTTAVNRTRAEFGLAPLTLEQVVGMVGEGSRKLLERAIGSEIPAERFEEALERYLEIYPQVALDTTRPYPGVPEMLAALAPRYPLALLSNKGEAFSRHILEGLGLARWFREVLGGDSLPTRKPDPSGLALLAGRLGAPLSGLMLIGDSWVDGATARAAGCRFALVEWGFPRMPGSDRVEADLKAATPADLAAALLRYPRPSSAR